MDKMFKKIVFIAIPVIFTIPFLLNFLINIDPYVIFEEKISILQAYAGYFGGAIGGLATLIAIYLTVLEMRKETKPLLFFKNQLTYLYIETAEKNICFSKNYYAIDENILKEFYDNKLLNDANLFYLHNIGANPALDIKLKIINMDKERLNPFIEIAENYEDTISHLLKGEEYQATPPFILFDTSIYYLIESIKSNSIEKKYYDKGKYKLYDIQMDYKDIDNHGYTDFFTLSVKLRYLTYRLSKVEKWQINLEFYKTHSQLRK